MRGRKPSPTKLKTIFGNPGKRKLNPNEPEPEVAIPDCPDHLDSEARAEWDRLAPKLLTLKLISHLDRAAFAAYCQSWSRWVHAERMLAKTGDVFEGKDGRFYPSPYVGMSHRATRNMLSFLSEFGLSPATRARLNITPGNKETSAFEAFANAKCDN